MIIIEDQNQLFLLIADKISKDIECVAFGGTAMMYKQYKNATKDIDLVFFDLESRDEFARAIKKLGYKESNYLRSIYPKEKSKMKTAPLMYTRGDERFDLFVKNIFNIKVNESIRQRSTDIRDFNGKKLLRLRILGDEDLILLKAITSREGDFKDIEEICKNNPNIDWGVVVNEAINQGNLLIVIDLEEKMKKLEKELFIKKKYFDRLYAFDKS